LDAIAAVVGAWFASKLGNGTQKWRLAGPRPSGRNPNLTGNAYAEIGQTDIQGEHGNSAEHRPKAPLKLTAILQRILTLGSVRK
jgi:hypothetical protein